MKYLVLLLGLIFSVQLIGQDDMEDDKDKKVNFSIDLGAGPLLYKGDLGVALEGGLWLDVDNVDVPILGRALGLGLGVSYERDHFYRKDNGNTYGDLIKVMLGASDSFYIAYGIPVNKSNGVEYDAMDYSIVGGFRNYELRYNSYDDEFNIGLAAFFSISLGY